MILTPLPQNSASLTVDQALRQALARYQAGQLQDAERLYRDILQVQPQHPDANHNLGTVMVQMQQSVASLPYFEAALNANPESGQCWLSYIDALIQAGLTDVARQALATGQQFGLQGEVVEALVLRLAEDMAEELVSNPVTAKPRETIRRAKPPKHAQPKLGRKMNARQGAEPDAVELNGLGVLYNQGLFQEMEVAARRLTVRFPKYGVGWKALGVALQQQGHNAEALAPLQKAVALLQGDAEAHYNLGNTLKDLDRSDEAEASYRRALQIRPGFADAHNNLGNILNDQDRLDEAETCCRRALEIQPDYAEAHNNLGNTLKDLGRLDEAEASYRRALEVKPDYAEAHSNLGYTLYGQDRFSEAEASCRQALQIKPDLAEAYSNLGNTFREQSRFSEAEASFRRALEIKPDYAAAYSNLGVTFNQQGRVIEAEASYRRALEIKPDYAAAHNNLGNTLHALGRSDEAEVSFRRALEIKPDYAGAHSNLIFVLDMTTGTGTSGLQEERRRWSAIHAAHISPVPSHANLPNPERRLRIGYVSADFKNHSAAYVFGPMLMHFDPSRYEVYAYSNTIKEDSLTQLFQQSVSCWRKIVGVSDEVVAEMIRQDEIDILVDLSGHSAGNRLLVFARKPAPIQVTAWGYIGGTGMKAMDVFFADPVVVPPEEKQFYAEEVRYLPNVVGSLFPYPFPEVNPLPAMAGNGVTFGSLNRLVKISEEAYRVWSQVLLAIPGSRIVLKTGELDNVGMRARVSEHFIRAGVDPERITLLGRTSWRDHVAAFNQIDITLDPFPHGGGVTTLEGLMMGVPVVTLCWPTLVGRLSASILTTLGLTDWIAETPEQYVEIAIRKAQDLSALAELRQQMRRRLTDSIIGDAKAYTGAVEQEYRQLWWEFDKTSLKPTFVYNPDD